MNQFLVRIAWVGVLFLFSSQITFAQEAESSLAPVRHIQVSLSITPLEYLTRRLRPWYWQQIDPLKPVHHTCRSVKAYSKQAIAFSSATIILHGLITLSMMARRSHYTGRLFLAPELWLGYGRSTHQPKHFAIHTPSPPNSVEKTERTISVKIGREMNLYLARILLEVRLIGGTDILHLSFILSSFL